MAYSFYGVCHDCKEYVDLYKFWQWPATGDHTYATMQTCATEELEPYKDDWFIRNSVILHLFLHEHEGHRIGVYYEGETFGGAFDDCDFNEDYHEVGCEKEKPKNEHEKKREIKYDSKEQQERVETFFKKRKEGT